MHVQNNIALGITQTLAHFMYSEKTYEMFILWLQKVDICFLF